MDAVDLPALALLGVVLGVLAVRAVLRERRDYARFKRLRGTIARQKTLRRWLLENVVALGGLSVATVVGAWAWIEPALTAAQAWAPIAAVRDWLGQPWGLAIGVAVVVLLLAALVVPVLAVRGSIDEAPALGDIRALLPRTRGELPYGAGLALSAGIFEELLFRLGLPALLFGVTGSPVAAFLVATVVFGMLHAYQGPLGVAFATVLGAVFLALYLVTGTILAPILLHALIDLRSMVLIPIVIGRILQPAPTASTR